MYVNKIKYIFSLKNPKKLSEFCKDNVQNIIMNYVLVLILKLYDF